MWVCVCACVRAGACVQVRGKATVNFAMGSLTMLNVGPPLFIVHMFSKSYLPVYKTIEAFENQLCGNRALQCVRTAISKITKARLHKQIVND